MKNLKELVYNGLDMDRYVAPLDMSVLYNIYVFSGQQGQEEIDLSDVARSMGVVDPKQYNIEILTDSIKRLQKVQATANIDGKRHTQAALQCDIYTRNGRTYIDSIELAPLPDTGNVAHNMLADIMAGRN